MLRAMAFSRLSTVPGLTGEPTNWWYSAPIFMPASKAALSLGVTAIFCLYTIFLKLYTADKIKLYHAIAEKAPAYEKISEVALFFLDDIFFVLIEKE
jgi:hypothetical protein